MKFFWAVCLALCVSAAWPAAPRSARSIEGPVTYVSDGDSLWVQVDNARPLEVRLRDIDAPELCQAWGPEARKALQELVLQKRVSVQLFGKDAYGRAIGRVALGDVDVGQRLVEEGHAWSQRIKWDRGPLVKQERMARALSRGLHVDRAAVMPRDFRRDHGPCAPVAGK